MHGIAKKVSPSEFVLMAEILDKAFPSPPCVPDYLLHECEEAQAALLRAIGATGSTRDPKLAQMLSLKLLA